MSPRSLLVFRRAALVACLVGCGAMQHAQAGSPQIKESGSTSSWLSSLNPAHWSLPSIGWGSTPSRSASPESPGAMSQVSRQMGQAWQKTKQTLNPKNLLPAADKPPSQTRTAKREQESVWSRWFSASEEPEKIETVNDFLRQPSPY